MQKTMLVFMLSALIALTAACSNIQRTTTVDGVTASRVTVAEAKVVGVDYENRTVVVKDKNGTQLINLGSDARNFDQIKVGDTVIAEVIETVRVVVKESNEEPSADVFETAQRDPLKPGAQKVTVSEATARVEKINYETRMITLSGPKGKRFTTQAGPEIKRLEAIKPGDMISMQIVTQKLIRVESPE